MAWLSNVKKATLKFEGLVTHMYLDTKGFVTVGVGHLLRTKGDAARLPFVKRDDKKPASKQEIEEDWTNVKKQTQGRAAANYEKHTKLDLPTSTVNALFERKLKEFESGIRGVFPKFNSLPDPAKEALMDIAYNTGIGGLRKFKKLKAAIDKDDWATAAKESKRPGSRAERNAYVRDLFLQAQKVAGQSGGK